ncbi:MAG: hypothetical protein FD146_1316 [Anaerolineaceae bacterium]|nr:MAG: hypothetical protein FD146_1316 [Anaerolineaceae bacterium]
MSKNDEINPQLIARLEELRNVPARDPHTAARGRARFLAQAAAAAPVSAREGRRHKDWRLLSRKERLVMNTVISIVVTLVVLLSGGVTVAAAQDDLPNQPLYQVKLSSEDARLWLNADPQTEVGLLMQLVQTRVSEMNALAAMGVTPPAQVKERLEQHLQQAFQIAAGMEDAAMQGALVEMQNTFREQLQIMNAAQTQNSGETAQVMLQVRAMLENRLRLVEAGMADPQGFQNTYRHEEELRIGQTGTPQPSGTPVPGGNGNGGNGNGGPGTVTPPLPGGTETPQGTEEPGATPTPCSPDYMQTPTPGESGHKP